MKALIVYLLLSLASFTCVAKSAPEELPPLDPAYEGVHGMVLMKTAATIFAYHLPLYHKPHDVQLLYKLEVNNIALAHLLRDNALVTIKPKPFNLQRLMRGEKLAISADIYLGHYERDGVLVYKNITLNFAEKLYMRKLENAKPSSNEQEYDVVSYQKNNKIYIHRLQQAPSFDHLIHLDVNADCLTTFTTSAAVPKRNELQYKFYNCDPLTPLYFETEDFQL